MGGGVGSKFPIANPYSGGFIVPSGGDTGRFGHSARLVWRGDSQTNVSAKGYIYDNDRFFLTDQNRDTGNPRSDNAPGDEVPTKDSQFPRRVNGGPIIVGQWQTARIEQRMNTRNPDGSVNKDGSIKIMIDGEVVDNTTELEWMRVTGNGEPEIDVLLLAGHHGGGGTNYHASVDSFIRYRNMSYAPI